MRDPAFVPLASYREYPVPEMLPRSRAYAAGLARRRTVRQFSDRPVPSKGASHAHPQVRSPANTRWGRFSLSASRHVGVIPDRWSLGVGLRATAYAGAVTEFRNRGTVSGTLAAMVPIDPAVYGINAVVATDLRVAGPVHLEFNLDVAGLAGGPLRRTGSLDAKPATGLLFLYGSRDRGSLNSELAVSLALSPRVRLRGGTSHYVVGYTVTDRSAGTQTAAPRSRYQRSFTVPFLAISLGR